jgi:hypothetical protein
MVAEPAGETLRYRLPETIRLFAAERLAEAGDEQAAGVAAAHCAHFLGLAEQAAGYLTGPEQGSWLARLDADQANLRRAAGHAAGRPDRTAVVLRLGVALERYWLARSREQEGFGLLVPVLRRPEAGADPRCSARRWSPPRPSLTSLTWPRRATLPNTRSRSRARWATSGCSAGPWRHCAVRISPPASWKLDAGPGTNRLSGPGILPTTVCWPRPCSAAP